MGINKDEFVKQNQIPDPDEEGGMRMTDILPESYPKEKKPIPRKRNGYYYRDGKEYVSITKILKDTINKPALMFWYAREAARIALKNPNLTEEEVYALLTLNLKDAQTRGNYVHNIAERFPESRFDPEIPEFSGYRSALQSWWDSNDIAPIEREIESFSETYKVACRVDLVASINGVLWSVDYKSGKDIYKEVEIQLAFGKQALEEDHNIRVEKTGVVLLMEDGSSVFKETKGTIKDFEHVKGIWDWLKRKG